MKYKILYRETSFIEKSKISLEPYETMEEFDADTYNEAQKIFAKYIVRNVFEKRNNYIHGVFRAIKDTADNPFGWYKDGKTKAFFAFKDKENKSRIRISSALYICSDEDIERGFNHFQDRKVTYKLEEI